MVIHVIFCFKSRKLPGCCPDFHIFPRIWLPLITQQIKWLSILIVRAWAQWKMNRCYAIRCLIALTNAWRGLVFIIQGSPDSRPDSRHMIGPHGSFSLVIGQWRIGHDSVWLLHYISRQRKQTGVLQHPSEVFVMDWFWFGYFLSWHKTVICSLSCHIISGHKHFSWVHLVTGFHNLLHYELDHSHKGSCGCCCCCCSLLLRMVCMMSWPRSSPSSGRLEISWSVSIPVPAPVPLLPGPVPVPCTITT